MAPIPSALFSAQIRPPWASTMERAMASPSPMPCALLVKKNRRFSAGWRGRYRCPDRRLPPECAWRRCGAVRIAIRRRASRQSGHGVHAVQDQIQQDLLQPAVVAEHGGQLAALSFQLHVTLPGFDAHQFDDVLDHVVHVDGIESQLAIVQQLAQAG